MVIKGTGKVYEKTKKGSNKVYYQKTISIPNTSDINHKETVYILKEEEYKNSNLQEQTTFNIDGDYKELQEKYNKLLEQNTLLSNSTKKIEIENQELRTLKENYNKVVELLTDINELLIKDIINETVQTTTTELNKQLQKQNIIERITKKGVNTSIKTDELTKKTIAKIKKYTDYKMIE